MPRKPSTTRTDILDTAMTMFIERGYDKTSLREIADSVGVTKAALYYYFRTKDEIVRATLDEYATAIGALLDWLHETPPSAGRNEQLVDRVLDVFDGGGSLALQFIQANPTVIAREGFGDLHIDYIKRLVQAIAGEHPSDENAARATLSFGALLLSVAPESPLQLTGDAASRRAASRTIALELLAPLSA